MDQINQTPLIHKITLYDAMINNSNLQESQEVKMV